MSTPLRRIAIITGTSGNLGINLAYRLCEEVPSTVRLTLIVTSRTLVKANETIHKIQQYNKEHSHRKVGLLDFDYLLLDFGDMISVCSAIWRLKNRYDKLDYLFLNASQNSFDHFDYIEATKEMLTDPVRASTDPGFKIEKPGVMSKDGLGLVFQVNVFGPFYFIEKLKEPLFSKSDDARIIWISSILSSPKDLSFNDLSLVKTTIPYNGSKRLIDLAHLATFQEAFDKYGIKQYLTHPGIFVSYTYARMLNVFSYLGMLILFNVSRLLKSPWQNITGWRGANAPIFAALKAIPGKDNQALKYGSACSQSGKEYVKADQVDPTGMADVLKYLKQLESEWDDKLKDQITDTRRAY